LEDYGFEINTYNPCVAKKTKEDERQMTVIWHVDDLMTSSEDDFDLTKFSCYLTKIYRPKLTMHTGNKHSYLGVDTEFKEDGTLDISMFAYLRNVIKEFPELIMGKAPTSAVDHLFKIRDKKEAKPLEEEVISLSSHSAQWHSSYLCQCKLEEISKQQ
jgi:hypothetical protein